MIKRRVKVQIQYVKKPQNFLTYDKETWFVSTINLFFIFFFIIQKELGSFLSLPFFFFYYNYYYNYFYFYYSNNIEIMKKLH